VLTKGTNGVKAKFIGTPWMGSNAYIGVDDVEIISADGSNLIFKGFKYENLYLVDFNASEAKLSTCLFTKSSMGWLWHRGWVMLE
jgi:hypothetical protein